MANRWFRFYDEVLEDPKVQLLSPVLFKVWVNLLCMSSKHDGILPNVAHISYTLRLKTEKIEKFLAELQAAGLIDSTDFGLKMHNWDERQYKSDVSTERVREFRKRFRNVSETGIGNKSETPPDTEQIQKQIQSQKQSRGETLAFGEFANVILTNEEYEKLKTQFTPEGAQLRIEELSIAIASKGLKYKSHYATIKSWARLQEKKSERRETTAEAKDRERAEINRRVLEGFGSLRGLLPGDVDPN